MHDPTNKTATGGWKKTELRIFCAPVLFIFFMIKSNRWLELQIIECTVPKIADKIETYRSEINQPLRGKRFLIISGTRISGELNMLSGVDKIIELIKAV